MLKADVKAHFGTLDAIADAIGITKSAVSNWDKIVPQGSAYKIQVVTGGKLRVDPSLYKRMTRPRRKHGGPTAGPRYVSC